MVPFKELDRINTPLMTKMTLPHKQRVHQVRLSALKNDALYTAAAGKQTKMAAGGNGVEKEDSLLTDKVVQGGNPGRFDDF